ncbi:MAG TPA: ABC transporter permease [Thermodesulfobacteriota bacterium]
MRYLVEHPQRVLELALQHLEIVAASVLVAVLIGVPVGVLVTRLRWLEGPVMHVAGVLYTVPSLALFAVLIPFTGLGARPAIVALILYSLLAIIRNTVAGIDAVDPATLEAARGMGMTGTQRLLLVELPLGLPIILAGVRLAAVAAIGIATVAAYVGAGGLGLLIFDGLRTLDADRVLGGALATSAMALAVDAGLARLGGRRREDTAQATGG